MKAYWGSGSTAQRFLRDWHWMEVNCQLHPQGQSAGTHWIGGWVCPRAGLDMVSKKKIPSPTVNWTRSSNHYTDWTMPALTPKQY